MARANIVGLTGLRFYAAAIIVYCHAVGAYFVPLDVHALKETYRLGNLGMTLFFVLSGFVIHYNYGESIARCRFGALWSFAVARFARLYPLYFASLILTFAFLRDAFHDPEFRTALPYYLTLTQDWRNISVNGRELANIYVGGAWSISAEVMLYLAYIPLARAITLLHTVRTILLAVGLILIGATGFNLLRVWFGYVEYYDFYLSPYCRFPEFLLGTLTAALYMRRAPAPTAFIEKGPLLIASLAFLMAMIFARYVFDAKVVDDFESSWAYAPPCAALMYFCARNPGKVWLLEGAPIVALGDASYSLYLLSGWGLWMFSSNGVSPGYATAGFRAATAIGFSIVVALGSFRYFEVPSRRLVRRVLSIAPSRFGSEISVVRTPKPGIETTG